MVFPQHDLARVQPLSPIRYTTHACGLPIKLEALTVTALRRPTQREARASLEEERVLTLPTKVLHNLVAELCLAVPYSVALSLARSCERPLL